MGLRDRTRRWLDAAGDEKQLGALCSGLLPMGPTERIFVLFQFAQQGNDMCLAALNKLESAEVERALRDHELPADVVDFLAQLFIHDATVVDRALSHGNVHVQTLRFVVENAQDSEVLSRAAEKHALLERDLESVRIILSRRELPAYQRGHLVSLFPNVVSQTEVENPGSGYAVKSENVGAKQTEVPSSESDTLSDAEVELFTRRVRNLRKELPDLSIGQRLAIAMKGDKECREILLKDPHLIVQKGVLANPKIADEEILKISGDRAVAVDLLRIIALNREWMKSYAVKISLTKNPKTPLAIALQCLGSLRETDIKFIAASKNLPSALVKQAEAMLKRKNG
jgi:hypothetical protein